MMNTIYRLFVYISCLVFFTGSSLFPINDVSAQAEADKSAENVRENSQELSIPNELDELLTSINLDTSEGVEGETDNIYARFSDICATMLFSINNVIAMNQELINRDPKTGNYFFKGAAPPVISSSVASDVSRRTGTKLKMTALRLRNPRNKPDLWEDEAMRKLEKDVTKEGVGELTKLKGKSVYRYMKPLNMEIECLMCHTYPEAMPPTIREYIEKNYPHDDSMGYHAGELRGGISVIISPTKDENVYEHFADISATMLLSVRNVIAMNQELINRDPETGNYYFKGAVPAIVGRSIANDFGLMTGIELKQTALRVRNPLNKPDEWEERALKELEKNMTKKGIGELTTIEGESVYRYMKPLFMEMQCIMCHSQSEAMPSEVREYIERNYSNDESLGYKAGELRGGISVVIPIKDEYPPELLSTK